MWHLVSGDSFHLLPVVLGGSEEFQRGCLLLDWDEEVVRGVTTLVTGPTEVAHVFDKLKGTGEEEWVQAAKRPHAPKPTASS